MDFLTGLSEGDFDGVVDDSDSSDEGTSESAHASYCSSFLMPSKQRASASYCSSLLMPSKRASATINTPAIIVAPDSTSAAKTHSSEDAEGDACALRVREWRVAGCDKGGMPNTTLQVIEDPGSTLVESALRGTMMVVQLCTIEPHLRIFVVNNFYVFMLLLLPCAGGIGMLWDSAIAMTMMLQAQRPWKGVRVLELGSGVGLTSMALAKLGE